MAGGAGLVCRAGALRAMADVEEERRQERGVGRRFCSYLQRMGLVGKAGRNVRPLGLGDVAETSGCDEGMVLCTGSPEMEPAAAVGGEAAPEVHATLPISVLAD